MDLETIGSIERRIIDKKNIYIFPTRFGFFYIAILFSIFLIGLTYTNNQTLIIAFWLLTVFIVQMLKTHRKISLLKDLNINIENGFANEQLRFSYKNQESHKYEISLYSNTRVYKSTDVNDKTIFFFKRGSYSFNKIKFASRGTFDLFYCWKYLNFKKELYIYPEKLIFQKDHIFRKKNNSQRNQDDEFQEYFPYNQNQPSRRIDWKVFAKTDQLLIKSFKAEELLLTQLSLNSVDGDIETKLQKLTFLINDYFRRCIQWSLEIEGEETKLSSDYEHYHQCLEMLARYK